MIKTAAGRLIYSPTDLVTFLESPFASWMDRYYAERLGDVKPDEADAGDALIARSGDEYEQQVLGDYRMRSAKVAVIERPGGDERGEAVATQETLTAMASGADVIYQARLADGQWAGYSDFLELAPSGRYEVWDTKLSRTAKPRYPIQLCAYTEMLAAMMGTEPGEHFGVILGDGKRVRFRTEDFIHYYRALKRRFLEAQAAFTGKLDDRPDPAPRAGNGRWKSHAEAWMKERDHLVQVAGISVGQIRKLEGAGVTTVAALATADLSGVRKMGTETKSRLVHQARLQVATREIRAGKPEAPPVFELLPNVGPSGEPVGLGMLPAADPADVYFDMEGYPLVDGGLEYLFGACTHAAGGGLAFHDWWAHDRAQERVALEQFVDWAHARWKASPAMHIYHYASYEVSAVRRLSTRHNTRQDEVDDLLRHEVFVDLYKVVRAGVRVGEDSYSLKSVERLYRPARATDVATAGQSIVEYNRWMLSGEPQEWSASPILRGIRDYNEDDCKSTGELVAWLRVQKATQPEPPPYVQSVPEERKPSDRAVAAAAERRRLEGELLARGGDVARVLSDVVDFHRREAKPVWWEFFDRRDASLEELRDDGGCIADAVAVGTPVPEARSLIQRYAFDPAQECTLRAGDELHFTHNSGPRFVIADIDAEAGTVALKTGVATLNKSFEGAFPARGSLIIKNVVPAEPIPSALAALATAYLDGSLPGTTAALLGRATLGAPQQAGEAALSTVERLTQAGDVPSFSVQGPPGTGKTWTAARAIAALVVQGKTVGISSNSSKAVTNLFLECGRALRERGERLTGVQARGDAEDQLFAEFPDVQYAAENSDARAMYDGGIVGGTAWLFSRDDWAGQLDYLFIDEAGQVSLANAVAMSRAARHVILLGDQMQLEQPVQGSHPGDSGLSVLQYALKDLENSREDAPEFHAVVPASLGVFLGTSYRMHPDVCRFISESIYEGRLASDPSCARQVIGGTPGPLVPVGHGIALVPVPHDGNVQQSDEEVERVVAVYHELVGRVWTNEKGETKPLALADFLFVAPYNAQVRALRAALPPGARVGSVDRFQGQQAAVCVLSLCASYGEYGSRGLAFILDRNRMNVALSRAKALAVVVADPRLAIAVPRTIEEMRLINLFAKVAGP